MSSGFEAVTPGPWVARRHGVVVGGAAHQYTNGEAMDQLAMACVLAHSTADDPIAERDANTRLIAEAGTVLHETGLTPRQLAERVNKLEAARIAYASEFPLNADGEPDVGNIHANIRQLAEQRAELLEALAEGRRAIGDHYAPNDCYATGPLTGDHFRDLVQCPACSFIAMHDAAIAMATQQRNATGGER